MAIHIKQLIAGYQDFYKSYFDRPESPYRRLSQVHDPKVLMVGCSDARVDPAIITSAEPGEMFVIRNVANLVPPCQASELHSYHGTSAAVEFAVKGLKVEHIIICGHSKCAGIRLLWEQGGQPDSPYQFVAPWVKMALPVRQEVLENYGSMPAEVQLRLCEEKAIQKSLENLMTFDWVAERVQQGELTLHGWHIDITTGELRYWDQEKDCWEAIIHHQP